ncbi:MAG: MgtC/SapB family protein [Motilibacteraceae bacterium]
MHLIASGFGEPTGQSWTQIGELLVAFALSSVIGLERQLRGKSAGLRTQAIVGTAAALILLVSKYGFTDILTSGRIVLDPSRVAAQIVSGVGFLGAGLIITRAGAIRGLTTAAAVWETAAIGMAAGAGLPLLAVVVTGLHFVIVLGYTRLTRTPAFTTTGTIRLRITYTDRSGVLRTLLGTCASHGWAVLNLAVDERAQPGGVGGLLDSERGSQQLVTVALTLTGSGVAAAPGLLASTVGVVGVDRADDDTE